MVGERMKLKVIVIIIAFILILCGWLLFGNNSVKVEIEKDSNIVGIFNYDNKNIEVNFSKEDINDIYEIFNDKKLYTENGLSCGFSENVSIVINEFQKFCMALDGTLMFIMKTKINILF